jgi:DamX protein
MKMAASELNNRLDYLISYSSQLVFVCSDRIQQQSKVIESFLALQNEQTDLALLTANELTPLVTYREKLFRQLVSQNQEADFNRPLNQLLAPLNNHNGPILISVFQAEKLPNKLVKELWDLVLQSRFANNKQHLNVLLMGLSGWAESAKSGLGAKTKDQPIMLNSQTDIQDDGPEEIDEFSDLESFIQDKRKKFAVRLEERRYQPYITQPIYKKWWVATLSGLVFLVIFAGMLGWQYPEKVSTIMFYINAQLSTQKQSTLKPTDIIELAEPASAEASHSTPQPVEEGVLPIKSPLKSSTKSPIKSPIKSPMAKKVSTKELLVTDWSTASAKLEEQSNKILLQTNNTDEQVDLQAKVSFEPEQPTQVKNVEAQTNKANDYQIEDKVFFEPIAELEPAQLVNIEPVETNRFLKPEPGILLALPNNNFVIQIAAMANVSILQEFIQDEQLGQQLWLYKTKRYGGDWYVLLKNRHFTSIESARAEIFNLSDVMLRNTPFVKSIGQIKQEIGISEL